ncbi:MAG: hypothetical protein HDQ99_02610 [Lachnospiraceae bacterium]|nr:hypothetical protein [Lachnospiraceae bacterium]
MNKEILNKAYAEINNFRDKLGENFYDAIQEDDNSTYEMAKGIISVFSSQCNTKKDFDIADAMLMAICGYSFETLVERIKELDEMGYQWENC